MQTFYVYILSSKCNGTLYIGVISDLCQRVRQHKEKMLKGFTEKYDVSQLVYYEETGDVKVALNREKQLKKWNRAWKIRLIEKDNSKWKDLYDNLCLR